MENSTPGTPEHQSIKSLPEDFESLDFTSSHGAESSEAVISDQGVDESPYVADEPTSNFMKQHDVNENGNLGVDESSSVAHQIILDSESSSPKSDNDDTSSGSSSEPSIAPGRVESMWSDTTPYVAKKIQSWFQLPDGSWDLVTIIKTSGNESLIKLSEAKVLKVNHDCLVPANPDILDGVDDLMQLGFLNEPSVLYNLQYRYDRDSIYTKAGPVLVAVNPLKEVPLYGDEYVQAYRKKKMEGPHVYAIADTAMTEMIRDEVNQSIIISGESGAGKTETAKIAMQYLATLCGGSGIEYEILKTNPILESFGNAKTARNNNSSRFGKLIEIHFSENGKICGAQIQTFLLEKSRVVLCTEGERSYHIFYQLCAGAPSSLKKKLNLKSAKEYKYLSQSSCYSISGVDDAEQFHIVEDALDVVHISKDNQEKIFAMVAAVLWLGEISFTVIDDEDHVEPVEDEGLVNVASLLGCDIEELKLTLSIRKMDVGEENIVQKLTLTQAIDSRDALAKSIYSCLFDWLVEQINKSLAVGKRCTGRSINILDIYGFESFGRNSFEQLCINYANERLQQHFNRHLFKLDQEEYIQDGIDWAKVEFEDNQECLNLFEKKPVGLLSLLDEETTFPSATDATFAIKLKQHLKFSPCFRPKRGGAFSISHYAGEVTYHTSGFLDKNRDFLHLDSIQLLSSCKSDLPQIFAAAMLSQSDSGLGQLHKSGGADSQKLSVATKFKGQLFQLMQRLENTTSHFIRCIKPNNLQSPGIYDQGLVLQQLRCCGVLEVVRISRSGFPTRMSHKKFARRYGFLLLDHIASQDPLTVSVAILHQFNILPEMYHVGYTKLFFRTGQMGMLEDTRTRTLNGILRVQSCFRGHQARCKVRVQQRAIATIQALVQGGKTRKVYAYLVHRHRAAIVIQKRIKGRKERKRFEILRSASVEMQAVIRGWLVRQCTGDVALQQFGKKGKQVWVKATYLAELQHKVLKSESALREKDEANEILSQRVQQYDSRWSEYERKMKSMEQVWQNQMTSIQSNLAGENTSLALDDENECMDWETANAHSSSPGGGPANPGLTVVNRLAEEFQQRSQVFSDDANFLVEVKSGQVQADLNPERELKELKHMFETWKKDYSSRLRETKVVLNKIGREEASAMAAKKTWWGRRNSSRMN